jgi:hypothetical protein
MSTEHQQYSLETKLVCGQGGVADGLPKTQKDISPKWQRCIRWWAGELGVSGVRWTTDCLRGAKDCQVGGFPLIAISKADSRHIEIIVQAFRLRGIPCAGTVAVAPSFTPAGNSSMAPYGVYAIARDPLIAAVHPLS